MFKPENIFLFNNISEEEKKIISEKFNTRTYKAGETIYSPKNYIKALGVITEGKAVAMTGKTQKRAFYQGDVFGVAALYGDNGEYISDIVAKQACTVAFMGEEDFKAVIKGSPQCAENYIIFLSDKIRFLNNKIAQYSCGDCEARLVKFIQDNATDGKYEIKNMSEAAKTVGLSRSHFYEALDSLEKKQIIKKEGKTIYIK